MRMAAGFGQIPIAKWEITEWRPRIGSKNESLLDLAKRDETGFAWPTPNRWKIFPPYWET